MEIIFHYPPEVLNLLIDTIPLLCRSKEDVIIFFQGAGVSADATKDLKDKLAANNKSVNKYQIARTVLVRLNDKGESSLRERREIIKRVVEFEDFSTCWPDDQLKARGLVGEIRRVVDVKDSFVKMRQEKDLERERRQREEKKRIDDLNDKRSKLSQVKKDLYALFAETDVQKRGKQLENALNSLFATSGILLRESFTRVSQSGDGVIEQVDGVIELDGEIYLTEMKWWQKPLGTGEVSQHLVRVFSRSCARGILFSYSDFTAPAVATCKESLNQMVVVLCRLQEIIHLLDQDQDLAEFLRTKIRAAIIDKNPYHGILQ